MKLHHERRRLALALRLVAIACLAACGGPGEPRFAEVSVSSAAPSATLSGSTHGVVPAIELSPGCPGYLDPSAPEHVVHVTDATAITITARSQRGPLALAIAGEGEIRCDSDSGAGHAPHVTITTPGDYAVHVASLHEGGELPYELTIAPEGSAPTLGPSGSASQRVHVSVTVTSEPAGATVRTPEGLVVGTTPAMFVVDISPDEVGSERRYVLEMPGRGAAEVSGRMIGGAVVLHATMPGASIVSMGSPPSNGTVSAAGPELTAVAADAQRIRDYQVARQSLEIANDCTVTTAAVDLDVRHSYVGDLRVVLRSPSGTRVTLHDHGGGSRANLVTSFDWNARRGALQALAGENARGRWEMEVHDDAGADTGSFRAFTLRLGCREGAGPTNPSAIGNSPAVAHPPAFEAPDRSRRSRRAVGTRPTPPRAPRVTQPRVLDPFAGRPTQPIQPWQSPPSTGRNN